MRFAQKLCNEGNERKISELIEAERSRLHIRHGVLAVTQYAFSSADDKRGHQKGKIETKIFISEQRMISKRDGGVRTRTFSTSAEAFRVLL